MKNLLKGNYENPKKPEGNENSGTENRESSLEEEFEAEALRQLGGSITFVKKSNSFIWRGDEDE